MGLFASEGSWHHLPKVPCLKPCWSSSSCGEAPCRRSGELQGDSNLIGYNVEVSREQQRKSRAGFRRSVTLRIQGNRLRPRIFPNNSKNSNNGNKSTRCSLETLHAALNAMDPEKKGMGLDGLPLLGTGGSWRRALTIYHTANNGRADEAKSGPHRNLVSGIVGCKS